MNIINNSGKDSTDIGIMCDTYKVDIVRTYSIHINIIINIQLIEELSLMKNSVLKSEFSKSIVNELLLNICCE